MLGQPWDPNFEEVAKHRHIYGQAPQVVGEVAFRQNSLYHEDHHFKRVGFRFVHHFKNDCLKKRILCEYVEESPS